jgi:hypothetical protein
MKNRGRRPCISALRQLRLNRTLVLEPVRGLRLVPLQDAHPASSSFPNLGQDSLEAREC